MSLRFLVVFLSCRCFFLVVLVVAEAQCCLESAGFPSVELRIYIVLVLPYLCVFALAEWHEFSLKKN